jgi:hypothetical protein
MRAWGRCFDSRRAVLPVSVKTTMVSMPRVAAASTAAPAAAAGKLSTDVVRRQAAVW